MPKYDEYARPVEKPGWYKTGYPMSAAVSVVDVSYFRRRGKRLVVRLKPQVNCWGVKDAEK